MKEVWLLLVIALVVFCIVSGGAGLPRVGRVSFDGPVQIVHWWNPFERAAAALELCIP